MKDNQKELKRIDPLSAGKMLMMIYGILGAIIGIVYSIMIFIFGSIAGVSNDKVILGVAGGAFGGLLIGAFFVVMYALIGFLAGIIGAAIYNLVAKKVGGLKLELE